MTTVARLRALVTVADAGSVRDAARLIAAGGTPARDDLMRLEPADFLASRVFTS